MNSTKSKIRTTGASAVYTPVRVKSHKEVETYLSQLRDGMPERKEEAKKALIRSGVLKKNGKKKDIIVSWE